MVWVVNRIIRNLLFQCRFEESVSFLGQIASPQNVWAEKTSVCCRKAGRRAIVRASTAPSRPLEPNFANTYRCSRNRSGQSTLEPFRTTVFNTKAATHSIKITYFHSISTDFNQSSNLVRDQGVGGSNPLSPTIKINNLHRFLARQNS